MLGNDQYGDCVWAGAAHEHMVWNAANKRAVSFTDADVLASYTDVTGFDSSDPNSDQGTDMATAADYRLKTGILSSDGQRHKIGAYLALEPGNVDELLAAAYLFGAVGIGITVTSIAMWQFQNNHPWTFRSGGTVEGGHYVPVVGRKGLVINSVSWGRIQPMSPAFYQKQSDEALAYVSDDDLIADKSPEGFDRATLLSDLKTVSTLK